ncbi:MAG: hypothetical protein ACTSYL_12645 [Candidatus Thorarchaeota archaeon]
MILNARLYHNWKSTLRAVDISLINSKMLPQIVFLSMIFLGEMPELLDWAGLVMIIQVFWPYKWIKHVK